MTFRHENTEDAGGKYWKLNKYLSDLKVAEWHTSFSELEDILGFSLPDSAYMYRPWWANASHSQSLAWTMTGWETRDVNMEAETLIFCQKDVYLLEKKAVINPTYRLKFPSYAGFRKSSCPLRPPVLRYIALLLRG